MAVSGGSISGQAISDFLAPSGPALPAGPPCYVCCSPCKASCRLGNFCFEAPDVWSVPGVTGFTNGTFNCSQWNTPSGQALSLCQPRGAYGTFVGDPPCALDNWPSAQSQDCWQYCQITTSSIFTGSQFNLTGYCAGYTNPSVWILQFCNNGCGPPGGSLPGPICCAQYVACMSTDGSGNQDICDSADALTMNFFRYWDPINKTTCTAFCSAVPSTLTLVRKDVLYGCGFCTCDSSSTGADGTCVNDPIQVNPKFTATITASDAPTLFRVGDSFPLNYQLGTDKYVGNYSSPSFGTMVVTLRIDASSGSFKAYLTITGCPEGDLTDGAGVPPDYVPQTGYPNQRPCLDPSTAYCCQPFEVISKIVWNPLNGIPPRCGFPGVHATFHIVEG